MGAWLLRCKKNSSGGLHNGGGTLYRLPVALFSLLILVAAWVTPAASAPVSQEPEREEKRVILLVVDRLSYPLMREKCGPVLHSILSRGAIGLMNARAGSATSEGSYLSIGAGARAMAGPEGGQAYQREEEGRGIPAGLEYLRNTGRYPAGRVCHPQINTLLKRNSDLGYPVNVGYLGQQLADRGLAVAVFGNGDHELPDRSAVLIAMDRQGEVPQGQIGSGILKEDPLFPYGWRTDIGKLFQLVTEALPTTALIVLDFGDFARLDQYWERLSPVRQQNLLEETMGELELLLADLESRVGGGTALILVAPTPPKNLPGEGESLVPCLLLEAPAYPGLLTGNGTRRLGLLTNTDLAPVLISYLAGDVNQIGTGPDLTISSHPDPLNYLDQFYNRSNLVYRQRPPLLRGYILALIGWLLLSLGGLSLGIPAVARLNGGFKLIMLFPLAALLLGWWPGFPTGSVYLSALLLAGLTGILLFLLTRIRLKNSRGSWVLLGLITVLALLLDTLSGSNLQKFSLLGYDPIVGARYYGLGNEYMGVLIGSALLGSLTMVEGIPAKILPATGVEGKKGRATALAVFFIYLFVVFLLSSPQFGANFGGTLTAAVTFGAAWAGLGGSPGRKADLPVTIGYFLLVALLLLVALNYWGWSGLASHVGRLGEAVAGGNLGTFWETVGRKAAMNWRLIRYSIWSRALVVLLGVMVVLCFYPVGVLKRLYRRQPVLLRVSAAGVLGALVALLTNDSGVVAAALVLLYTVPPLWIGVVNETVAKRNWPRAGISSRAKK